MELEKAIGAFHQAITTQFGSSTIAFLNQSRQSLVPFRSLPIDASNLYENLRKACTHLWSSDMNETSHGQKQSLNQLLNRIGSLRLLGKLCTAENARMAALSAPDVARSLDAILQSLDVTLKDRDGEREQNDTFEAFWELRGWMQSTGRDDTSFRSREEMETPLHFPISLFTMCVTLLSLMEYSPKHRT